MFSVAATELGVEHLSSDGLEVVDDEGPEMKDIISEGIVPHFRYDNAPAQQSCFDSHTETTRACSDDEHLRKWKQGKL